MKSCYHIITTEKFGRSTTLYYIPYSRKYWRALNLAVEPKIAIARILADLNLAVRYGIAIRIYASRKFWRILIWRLQYRLPNLIPRQIFRLYGIAKKDSKSGSGTGGSGYGKTRGESSTDLATTAGGPSIEEQPKADFRILGSICSYTYYYYYYYYEIIIFFSS